MSYASLHPQFVQYSTDGLGRDTYIGYNNGGFCLIILFIIQSEQFLFIMNLPLSHTIVMEVEETPMF